MSVIRINTSLISSVQSDFMYLQWKLKFIFIVTNLMESGEEPWSSG
jgi:hypothetical protein